MSERASATVGDIATLTDGPFGSNLKTSHYVEAGPRVIRLQNIGDGVFRDEQAHITSDHFERLAKHHVLPGDIVVASLGENPPRACLVPAWLGPALVKADCIRVRPANGVEPAYLMWILNSLPVRKQASTRVKGVGRPRLGLGGIRQLEVPLAPLNEQRRIVAAIEEHLSRLDAADASLAAAARRLRPLRELAFEASHNGAPTSALGDVLREPLRNGYSAKADPSGTIRTLTLSSVTRNEFTDENTKLTSADPAKATGLWLEPGDIFIERSNTPELVGTAALYDGPRDWAIFPDLLIRVRVADSILPKFLETVLKSRRARSYFQRAAQGIAGSMPKIDQGVVERLKVPVPPLEEQRRIVQEVEERLSRIDALRASIERAQRRSRTLRAAILERAFHGELVPQGPADEPAEALLARIRADRADVDTRKGHRAVK